MREDYFRTGYKTCKDCKKLLSTLKFPVSRKYMRRDGTLSIILASCCRKCHNARCVKNNRKARLNIINHYSHGKLECSQCSESRYDCLDLDHVNNNSKEDRTSTNPYKLYRRLIKDNYPEGYQILCRNCNWIKHLKNLKDKKCV